MADTQHLTQPIENTNPDKNQYRLNLALTRETKDELEILKNTTQKSSLADVIRAALALYKIIIEHQKSGGKVIFRHANNSDETLRFV